MIKLAIIGASYLQEPLIQKAKSRGIETHVFAWAAGDVGEKSADYFYPISIVEKEQILQKCREINIDGICSIASDLAAVTVNYVAQNMGLRGNSMECTHLSTNKNAMRRRFEACGDPSPASIRVESAQDLSDTVLHFPVIVKPTDRSGSRGITKVETHDGLSAAIDNAKAQGFEKAALVEEFAIGQEYSVEYISFNGSHQFLAMTKKYTTGAPDFIETGHLEPAGVDSETLEKVKKIVCHALDSLGITHSASHTELKIAPDGTIRLIEIGGRMGGDFIGSHLVELSTGYDFVNAVIDVALGKAPESRKAAASGAAIHFIFSQTDVDCLQRLKSEHPELLVCEDVSEITDRKVVDSGSRFGYFLMTGPVELLVQYMPHDGKE